jgi:ketosteroid isomerase-like protein
MSEENVEIARAAFEAWSRGDLDAWLAEADPEIEWYVLPEAPDPGPHRGRDAILERAALWRDMLALRGKVVEYIDAGEYVLMPVRMRGRPPGSDAEVVLDEVYVGKFRDGKVVELREYRTKAEAFQAVGLSEQDAHADSNG